MSAYGVMYPKSHCLASETRLEATQQMLFSGGSHLLCGFDTKGNVNLGTYQPFCHFYHWKFWRLDFFFPPKAMLQLKQKLIQGTFWQDVLSAP